MAFYESLVDWRQQYFPGKADIYYGVALNQKGVPAYFRDPRCWSLLGATTAHYLLEQYPGLLTYRTIDPAPQPRTGYVMVSRSYFRSDIIQAFLRCCREYVEEHPMLECLLTDDV